MDFDDFVGHLSRAKAQPSGTSAQCPAHDDKVASLMVNRGKNGGIVVKCHAGCTAEQIVTALGLSMSDLRGESRHVATYDYIDEQGMLRYSVYRYENPKTFRCVPGLPPEAERILYQSQAVAWARDNGAMVYTVEGEKDADTLVGIGIVATTNVTGAGKWLPHYAQQLIGCHVTIIADNDEVGVRHARHVYESIKDSALTVTLVQVPVAIGKDVTDLFNAGYDLSALEPLNPEAPLLGVDAIEVVERAIEWAWQGYIPFGKLTLIEGDPGQGKSLITIDLVARWSTNNQMPWNGGKLAGPVRCIMITAEDDPEDTLRPRLRAAGADLKMVRLITSGLKLDEPFSLANHLEELRRLVKATGARIIVLDPLMAFFTDQTDTYADASVRRALWPLKRLAEELHVVVLCVRHHNKATGLKALHKGGGSIGFAGAARAVFMVGEDPENEAGLLFLPVKMNLAKRPPTLKYKVTHTEPTTIDGEASEGLPYVEWLGHSKVTAQESLDGATAEQRQSNKAKESEVRDARRDQISFIYDCLADGPLPWEEIIARGKAEGFTKDQLTKARPIGHLQPVRISGEGNRHTTWRLPTVAELTEAGKSHFATLLPVALYRPEDAKWQSGDSNTAPAEQPSDNREGDSPSVITDSMRDSLLDAAPFVCEICGSQDHVQKHAGPYWKVRCPDHDPEFFDGS